MRLALFIALSLPAWAAIGDNAPMIPSTFAGAGVHPRLPAPTSAFLTSLNANSSALSRYTSSALGFNASSFTCSVTGGNICFRRLLVAYLACKLDTSGCAVGSNMTTYQNDINTLVSNGASAFGSAAYAGWPTLYAAMLYDWLYAYLTSGQRSAMQTTLDTLLTTYEGNIADETGSSPDSPYSDTFYLSFGHGPGGMAAAVALYGDYSTGAKHLRYMMDLGLNRMLPVWKQIMCGNGNCSGTGTDGGGWTDGWSEYQVNFGIADWVTTFWMPWSWASNDTLGSSHFNDFFTVQNPWLQRYGYYSIYTMRPDYTMLKIGPVGTGVYPGAEYTQGSNNTAGAGPGSIGALAEIYNDPVLRWWNRNINTAPNPDGFEPSNWPWGDPDSTSKTTTSISTLPLCHNFSGWGVVTCRTGWTENDTFFSFRYGDSFWQHPTADVGAFTIFSRGSLALESGSYQTGSYAAHNTQYRKQSVAHNVMLFPDPAQNNSGYLSVPLYNSVLPYNSNQFWVAFPNDGGQRLVGSGAQTYCLNAAGTGTCPINTWLSSQTELAGWRRSWEWFHMADLLAYVPTTAYTYSAVDLTRAYNNIYSGLPQVTPGSSATVFAANPNNRTQRIQKYVRHFVWIPRGHAAYVVVVDQVIESPNQATSPLTKTWLLHSINQPTLSTYTDPGNSTVHPVATILRTDNSCSVPHPAAWPGGWMLPLLTGGYVGSDSTCPYGTTNNKYQYNGKLVLWAPFPASTALTNVGGPGHEFDDNTGTNQSECQADQCSQGQATLPLNDYLGTSSSSILIPTSLPSSVSFAVASCGDYAAGQRAHIMYSANPSVDYMAGLVTSCSGTTLIVNVDTAGGGGSTFNSWYVYRTFTSGTSASTVTIPTSLPQSVSVVMTQPGLSFSFTSNSSLSIPTTFPSNRTFTLVVPQTYALAYTPGNVVTVFETSNPSNTMTGTVVSYPGTVTISVTSATGSGTYSDWTLVGGFQVMLSYQYPICDRVAQAANYGVCPVASPNFMRGVVTGWNSSTNTLTVNVDTTEGSGTYSDWAVSAIVGVPDSTLPKGYGWGISGYMHPDPTAAPLEPGSWRIEETGTSGSRTDTFVNLMLATNASDTNIPSAPTATVTGAAPNRMFSVSWSDTGCSYHFVIPENGLPDASATGTANGGLTVSDVTAGSCASEGGNTVN